MEATKTNAQESLREMVGQLVAACTDEDLLDLIGKLLMQSAPS